MAKTDRSVTNRNNAADDIERNLAQLQSMLVAIYGGGIKSFHEMASDQQDNYLWACHDRVVEIRQAWTRYQESPRTHAAEAAQ